MNRQSTVQAKIPPPFQGPILQRKCACGQHTGGGECEECRRKRKEREPGLQKKEREGRVHGAEDPEEIRRRLGPGRSFDGGARSRMEKAFRRDFSHVRLHTDSTAAELSEQVHARAFTVGEHVALSAGEYRPGGPLGDALLAHELAHVVQQGSGGAVAPLEIGSPEYDTLERDADRSAAGVLSSLWGDARDKMGEIRDNALPSLRSGLTLQRCLPEERGKVEEGIKDAESPAQAPAEEKEEAPPPPPTPGREMTFELAGKERKKWRVSYSKQADAQRRYELVRKLRVKAEAPVQEGENWTFYYFPLSAEEAEEQRKAKAAELGDKYDVRAEQNKEAQTFYLRVSLKCPEAMPAKEGFEIWAACFSSESEAGELRKKFEKAHIPAETHELDEGVYGLYYKPFKTAEEAQATGETAASARPGAAEGMYKVEAIKDELLKSFSYTTTTVCPEGYKDIGKFLCTSYVLAQEAEFDAEPKVTDPCGLKGTFREAFLFGSGVRMQGSGTAENGDIIHYAPKGEGKSKTDCFEVLTCPTTKQQTCATSGRTVAVDPAVIPLGKELLIEDVGPRVAEDTGGAIKDRHIDVYYGTDLTMAQANNLTLKDKKVCQKI